MMTIPDDPPRRHFHLTGRRILLTLTVATVIAAGVLGWPWLVALGVAPLLLAVGPCVLMCAVGICAMRASARPQRPEPFAPAHQDEENR